ncbi:Cytochrome c1 heme lyase [Pestalotiopsis sp. IQ-011]
MKSQTGTADSQTKTPTTESSHLKTLSCMLIARRLEQHDLTGDEKLANLIEHPETRDALNFFELDKNMAISRQHDRGTCEIVDDKDMSRQVYVIQTPLDTGGFWSLVLETISSKDAVAPDAFGLIQVDSDVKLEAIFEGIHNLAQHYGRHPVLVPLQLFIQHCSSTAQTFKAILNGVNEIDRMLSSELENTNSSASKEANALHRKMNLKTHQHSVMLADLRRRRTFENGFAAKLLPALDFNPGLQRQADRWAMMAKSNDLDIDSLPDKIESQRAVLFNLIAQLDTSLSTRLASESLRDSKAMKTLSILTILFLLGAFVASVLSTNMFPFRDQTQEIWIYFAIVIPLTGFLMLGWLLWLFMKPGGIDEEQGQSKNEKRD